MSNIVEMCFNPYSCSAQILINGKAPSDYSPLIQYMREPFYLWCDKLIDLLYDEINDKFAVIFVGRKFEAEVLKNLSSGSEKCISFTHKEFMVNTPLQKRMILLNEIIKKSALNINKNQIDVDFIVLDNKFIHYVNELEISNRFCFVKKHVLSTSEYCMSVSPSKYLFILCDDFSVLNKIDVKAECAFLLKIGSVMSPVSYWQGVCCIETSEHEVFDTIFNCFFFAPLCDAFVKCIQSLNGNKNIIYTDGFRILTAIKPLVKIDMPDSVELNRSTPLRIYTEPKTGEPPEVSFEYDRSGIVRCSNQRMEGLREGTVNILLYEKGSHQPFAFKQVKVIRRNRITSLLLSDKNLILGEDDDRQISVSFFPEDADNKNKIEWLSTDANVATVSRKGIVHAKSCGQCQIICTAENVSTRLDIEVKPYLTDLEIENLQTDGIVEITLEQDIDLSVSPVPFDAIDNVFKVLSSDTMIINTFGTTIHPVSLGEAEVHLINSSKRIQKSIKFRVVKRISEKTAKKKSFWNIFRKQ